MKIDLATLQTLMQSGALGKIGGQPGGPRGLKRIAPGGGGGHSPSVSLADLQSLIGGGPQHITPQVQQTIRDIQALAGRDFDAPDVVARQLGVSRGATRSVIPLGSIAVPNGATGVQLNVNNLQAQIPAGARIFMNWSGDPASPLIALAKNGADVDLLAGGPGNALAVEDLIFEQGNPGLVVPTFIKSGDSLLVFQFNADPAAVAPATVRVYAHATTENLQRMANARATCGT